MRLVRFLIVAAIVYGPPSFAQEARAGASAGEIEKRLIVLEERQRAREAVSLEDERRSEALARQQAARREAEDLVAQRRMAASTENIASLTGWQLLLAFFTTLGLAASLYLTRASILQTGRVISDNRRYSESELRAYVGLLDVEVENYQLGEIVSVKFCLKNYGATPALNVRSWAQRDVLDQFPTAKEHEMPSKLEFRSVADIPPGGTVESRFFISMMLKAEEMIAYEKRKKSVGFYLVITYEDVFGGKHVFRHSEFRSGKALYRSRKNPIFLAQSHPDIPEPNQEKFSAAG